MNSIEEIWSTIAEQSAPTGAFRLFDEAHPLDLFAGIDPEGRRVLMLITDEPPKELPRPGVIEVTLTQRGDGRFSLVFRLAREEFHELFVRLCQDLVETSRTSQRSNGTARLLLRLNRWQKLLEPGSSEGLSDLQLRGLFGELWFLKSVALPKFGSLTAVNAWSGPFGSPQDFHLGEGLVEIKTMLPGAHSVSISSAEQLESGSAPLLLAVIVIDASQGISPAELIAEIRTDLAEDVVASAEFDLRLAELGYSDKTVSTHLHFAPQEIRYFPVTPSFPKITISALPPGISGVRYDLDLLECGPYRSEFSYAA